MKLLLVLVFGLTISLITSQPIQIQNLNNNQGILPYYMGPAKSIVTHRNILHIIDLNTYRNNILKIYNTIQSIEKHTYSVDGIDITKLKLNELERKYMLLLPLRRQKRGIFYGLGTVIKTITGNMDANDAYALNKQIDNIRESTTNITSVINNHAIYNDKLSERITNITQHINKEQEKIGNFINKNANKIKNIEDIIQEQQYLNQVNYNIDLLTNHLTEIAETVALAKLNIISKSILSLSELEEIFEITNNESLKIISGEHLYEIIKLQAYYNSSNIILNIQIPVLSTESYKTFHLITLPIKETLEINIKPFIIYNEQRIQYFSEICPKIENTYICEPSLYQEETDQSQCIENLMNNREANCPMNDVGKQQNIIQIENNNILLINIPETLIKSTCDNISFTAKGTQLIRFKNCSVQINEITYYDTTNEYWDNTYIVPLYHSSITTNFAKDVLSLEKLKLQNTQQEKMLLETNHITFNNQMITYTTMILMSIFILTTFIIAKRKKIISYIIQDPEIASPTSKSLWPSLYLRGGGVTNPSNAYATATPQKPPRTTPTT